MPSWKPMRLTRRDVIGTSLLLGGGIARSATAQATPDAFPATAETLAHPGMLVDADWLAAQPADPDLIRVGFMPGDDFATGHIPDSVQIDWPALEVTDTSDASLEGWQTDVERLATNLGITRNSTVVAWDNGTLFATRLCWVLHYLGHERVHVLDGGLAAWREAGHPLEVDAPEPPTAADVPYRGTIRPDVLAQFDEVLARVGAADVAFVDARTADEYAKGHIPGAINVNYPENALPEDPKYWKPASELRALYEAAGVTPDRLVIPYCSTGVRSAVTWFSLRQIGYANVSLFTGSWAEWNSHPETPKVTGDQP